MAVPVADPINLADHLPPVTVADAVRRFSPLADIRDARAFAAELQAFVQERFRAVGEGAQQRPAARTAPPRTPAPAARLASPATPAAAHPVAPSPLQQDLQRRAESLRATARWSPGGAQLRRGREAMLEDFDQPHNLPLAGFARLAGKSRQQIYKDIDAGRLLALNVGRRGQRLPDWQLDPVCLALTQAVRAGVQAQGDDIDVWTLYRALSEPLAALGGQAPVQAVRPGSVAATAAAVLGTLGLHGEPAASR